MRGHRSPGLADREEFPGPPGNGPIRATPGADTLERSGSPTASRGAPHGPVHRARRRHAPDRPATPRATTSRTLWRVGGGLALAHVVLLFAGFSQEVPVEHGDAPGVIQKIYGGANLTRVFAGGYVEAMSFVVLAAAVVIVARLFGRRTETGRIAAADVPRARGGVRRLHPRRRLPARCRRRLRRAQRRRPGDDRDGQRHQELRLHPPGRAADGDGAGPGDRRPRGEAVHEVGRLVRRRPRRRRHRARALRARRVEHGLDDLVGRPRRPAAARREAGGGAERIS